MADTQEKKDIVKAQNFDEIVTSLADFTERASKEHSSLDKLEPHRKFLVKSKTPTIEDINKVVDSIDGQLIDLKNFNLEVLNVLTGVVVALSALDKEHISGILITANLAKEASEQAVNNVKSISAIITILKSQTHLRDIDQTWEDLEKQKELTKGLSSFKDELTKLQHLKNVDKLWEDVGLQTKSIEGISKRIAEISKALEEQQKAITSAGETIKEIAEKQQAFVEATNKHLADRQAAIDRHLDERDKALQDSFSTLDKETKKSQESLHQKADALSKVQTDTLAAMQRAQDEKLIQLTTEQTRQLDAIQKSQEEALARIADAQANALSKIEKDLTARIDYISKSQIETLSRIEQEQITKLEEINKSLEEEKTVLKASVATLTQKVKVAYAIVGGTAAITIIHLLLNVLGVL